MSATQAKQQRKQARKAIGETGLEVLGQHSQDLRLLQARLNELEAMLVKGRTEATAEYKLLWDNAKEADRILTGTLFGRLRWLLTGR